MVFPNRLLSSPEDVPFNVFTVRVRQGGLDRPSASKISPPRRIGRGQKRIMRIVVSCCLLGLGLGVLSTQSFSQKRAGESKTEKPATVQGAPLQIENDDIRNLNQALSRLAATRKTDSGFPADYTIGPNDLIDISVFEVPDLNRVVRVSNQGKISLPLVGTIQASGLTARELEMVMAELLRQKYLKNPQVSVFLKEYQSRPVTVYGAVKKPGVIQLQSPRTLIEMLAMAEGFTEDAGDYVTVRREPTNTTAAPAANFSKNSAVDTSGTDHSSGDSSAARADDKVELFKIRISDLVSSNDPKYNIMIQPGDAINIAKAGIVYVTGDVGRPGGFVLKEREQLTVLQAVSLAEGLRGTAAKNATKIIRKAPDGGRQEIAVNLGKIFEGKTPDVPLKADDILFVPASASKSALRRGAEAALQVGTGLAIYRR